MLEYQEIRLDVRALEKLPRNYRIIRQTLVNDMYGTPTRVVQLQWDGREGYFCCKTGCCICEA